MANKPPLFLIFNNLLMCKYTALKEPNILVNKPPLFHIVYNFHLGCLKTAILFRKNSL